MAQNLNPGSLPDVLKADMGGSEIQMDVDTETALVEPTSHRFDSSNGGRTTWIIPPKGVAAMADAALVFELVSDEGDGVVAYNFLAGGLGCVSRATLRSGGQIISQVEHAGLYSLLKKQFNDQDYKTGVLDARHKSSNAIEHRVAPALIANSSATDAFHQIYNPECDQVNTFSKSYQAGNNGHQVQPAKTLADVAGRGAEVVIRLAEIFPIFNSRANLPVFAMASMELEVEWAAAGQTAANGGTGANQTDSVLIQANIPDTAAARAQRTTATMAANPFLMMDFIHYPEEQMNQIQSQIETTGIVIPFIETVAVRGVNPQSDVSIALPGGADGYERIESDHILGMAGKEVETILIQKEYDIRTGHGLDEIDGAYNQVYAHRNILTNGLKSQDIPGEEYNFIINNVRVYNQDVSNKAQQHHYVSQCEPRGFQCVDAQYSTTGYDVNKCKELLDSEWTNGTENAQTINVARSKPYLAGTMNVLGLNLKKYNVLAPTVGNGQRIGSAPIQLKYSRVAIGVNGSAANSLRGAVNLNIFIEFKRTMLINPTGVLVSDA